MGWARPSARIPRANHPPKCHTFALVACSGRFGVPQVSRAHASPPTAPSIIALVLNYHQRERTVRFLRDLFAAEPSLVELIVVDNSSPAVLQPGDVVLPGIPVRLLTPGRNLGVAGGRNLGITAALEAYSSWEYLAMLDNDLIIPQGGLHALVAGLQDISTAAIAGPCIVDAYDPAVVVAAGGDVLPFFYPRYRGHRQRIHSVSVGSARGTAFVQGGAAVYRRTVLESGVRFDDRFNPYGPEDIDFCLAAAAAGFGVIVVPTVRFGHEGRGTYKTTLRHQRHLAAGE